MKRSLSIALVILPIIAGIGFMLAWLGQPTPSIAQSDKMDSSIFWTEDFSWTEPPPQYYITSTVGSGIVDNGSFLLTKDAMSQSGRIFNLNPTVMGGFTADFDIFLGSHDGADGIAFHFCPVYNYIANCGGTLDAGCPGGTFVGFDTYPAFNDTVYVAQGSYQNVLTSKTVGNLEDGAWHHATVTLEFDTITVILDGETVIDQFKIPGYTPFTGYFGFSAATGAAANAQRVDSIMVVEYPVILSPSSATKIGEPSTTVTFTETLLNATGASDSFELSLSGNTWPTTLSIENTDVLTNGTSVTFNVYVTVPVGTTPGNSDHVTVQATSVNNPTTDFATAILESYASSGQYGYIFNADTNQINVVDTVIHMDSGRSINTSAYGTFPWAGALSPDGQWLYTSLRDSKAVLVVDTASNTPVISITVGSQPFEIAFSPDGAYAFVGNYGGNTVDVIDTATQTDINTISINSPHAVASSPCLDKVYVLDYWGSGIYVLDIDHLADVQVITGFNYPLFDIVISPLGYRAYVTNQWNGTIYVIDTINDTWIDTWYIGASSQMGLDISPDGRTLYMISNYDDSVYAIDAFTGQILNTTIIGPISLIDNEWYVETFPEGMGNFLYASQPSLGQVSVIDTVSHEVVSVIATGGGLRGMALFPPESVCRSGALLDPPNAIENGLPGETAVYTQTLYNLSVIASPFVLTGSAPDWGVSLSQNMTDLVLPGGAVTFTVEVEVPADAQIADYDIASITATSLIMPHITAEAQLKTVVPRYGYVFNSDVNLVNVVDTAAHVDTGISIDTSPYGAWPWAGELSPDGKHLYISLRDDDAVLVVDTASNTPEISLTVGSKPLEIAFSPDGANAFVANYGEDTVSVIDTAALTVTKNIHVGNTPQGMASSPCLDKVYVADRGDYKIYVLDTSSLTVTEVITGFTDALFDIVISPLADRAYATNQWDREIYVINTLNDTWIDTFDVPSFESIESIDISPDGNVIYITSNSEGRTFALDAYTGEVITAFGTGPSNWYQGSWGIEVFPSEAGPYAYVSSPEYWDNLLGDLKILDLSTNQLVGNIYLGGGPRGMALFPPASVCKSGPTASFSPLDATVAAGEPIAFTNLSTGVGPLTYVWDFGDSSPVSSDVNPIHIYKSPGDFTITLTVESFFGTDQHTGIVHVSGAMIYLPIVQRR